MYGDAQVSRGGLAEQLLHVGADVREQLRTVAVSLQQASVLDSSVNPFGTGVATLHHRRPPLMRDLGFEVARNAAGFVERPLLLIDDPVRACRLGSKGWRTVRERHLITRHFADEMRLLGGVLSHAQPNRNRGGASGCRV